MKTIVFALALLFATSLFGQDKEIWVAVLPPILLENVGAPIDQVVLFDAPLKEWIVDEYFDSNRQCKVTQALRVAMSQNLVESAKNSQSELHHLLKRFEAVLYQQLEAKCLPLSVYETRIQSKEGEQRGK